MKLLSRILLIIIALLVLSGLGAYYYIKSDSPDYETGQYRLSGLEEPVEVLFDDFGVPHIYAQNEPDAYFALGFVHASERLFQMEMIRRAASGRLSEILGPDLLDTDILFRTIGLSEIARQSVERYHQTMDQPYQIAAQAYLDGINAFIQKGEDPIEFAIMGIEKTKFSLEDLYNVSGFMAYGFASGLKQEPIVERIRQQYGQEYLADLGLHYQGTQRIHSFRDSSLARSQSGFASKIQAALEKLPVPLIQGSNSWVIAPDRSSTGSVLFANDPHIGYASPSVWFEAHLETPGFSWYGYHLAGYPFAPIGHNRHHAVGLTMFLNDDTQFYRETVNPENPNQLRFEGEWEDLQIREETIQIKDLPDTVIQVRISRHGPIVNDAFKEVKGDDPVALWWVYLQQPNNLMIPSYELAHAKSIGEMESAVSQIIAPGLNVMYGDREGNIASWASARLARFPDHVNTKLYLDGASGEDELQGYYDFSDNPRAINPPWGYVYSANNQHDSMPGGYYPGYYAPDHRAKRIVSLLESRDQWTPEAMQKMTFDNTGPNLPGLVTYLLEDLEAGSGESARNVLADWDGSHAPQSLAPTIYYKLLYHCLRGQMEDELGPEDFHAFVNTYQLQNALNSLLGKADSPWWDNVQTTEVVEKRGDIVKAAWSKSIAELEAQFGPDLQDWQWEKAHYLEHPHPLGQVPPLNRVFNVGPIAVGSGHEVINNFGFNLDSTGRYRSTFGPSRRAIVDFSDPENSWSILPTGNSGHVGSKHYDDQAQMYARGEFRAQLMNRVDIEATKGGKWLLETEEPER